ncbi:hypothetical protein TNCV_3426821 [Trichonephila clavipes]|nr:hypothetical protein TNCV_3426821 [Trichonephila clavipes]
MTIMNLVHWQEAAGPLRAPHYLSLVGLRSLHTTLSLINAPHSREPKNDYLVSLNRTGDKRLTEHLVFSHHITIGSLKQFAAVLWGISLLSQTGPVNCYTMGLCLIHYAYGHTGAEDQKPNNGNESKPRALSPIHKRATCSYIPNHTCIEGCGPYQHAVITPVSTTYGPVVHWPGNGQPLGKNSGIVWPFLFIS